VRAVTDTPSQAAARAWLHSYGINTSRYTDGGGDHPAMKTLPQAFEAFAAEKNAALRAARDLITNLRQQDFESFTVAGVAETMDADEAGIIAKYDALIAQIDEVLNG
jgi:hypothetical protein